MQINRRHRIEISIVLGLVLFAGGSIGFGLFVGLDEIWANLKQIHPILIIQLLALSLLNFGLRAVRWHLFCRHLNLQIPFFRAVRTYLSGWALMVTPAKAGEGIRLWLINQSKGHPYRLLAPLIVADRECDALAFVIILIFAVGSFSAYTFPIFGFDSPYWVVVSIFSAYVFLKLILIYNTRALRNFIGFCHRLSRFRFRRFWASVRTGVRATRKLFDLKILIPSMVLSLAGWVAEFAALWLILQAFETPVPMVTIAFIFIFAMSVGAASLLPGGLGGVEATMALLLGVIGVGHSEALTATIVIRTTTFWFAVGVGVLLLPMLVRRVRHERKERLAHARHPHRLHH
ncbi:MAG: lysylphosphatidylglycerol synthase transmembrane domain-containing protein [Candidatus Pacebacteria bacterium]|nr:lysylphosphatidylglycerol synthase transmembrane domain-containing protein [Candidatus Paceibacterota bacterium]